MKRRLLSLLILAAMVVSLLAVPVRAAEQEELTGEWKDGVFTVTMDIPGVSSATLLAAAYENGQMTQVRTRNATNGIPVPFEDLDSSYLVRVFAIDPKNSQPLCEQEEVRNPDFLNPDDIVVFHDTVTLPTVDPEVTRALSSALSSYAQVMLALEAVDRYLTEKDADGRTRLDAVSSSSGQRLLPGGIGKNLPCRPDLGSVTVPTMAPVISKPVAHPAFDASMDQVNAAMNSCEQMVKANAVLAAAAEQEAAVLQSEVKAMEAASLQGGVSDEQLAWAKAITEHYDAIESNKKIAQLAKDMGCDAKRAYAQLVMAQNILKGQYSKEEGDLNELWEKRMIATKAGCKVGLFVCATIATAGGAAATATATAPLGYISAGEAAGIVVGAVDATLEVTTAGAKIVLGPDSKIVKNVEDKLKPVSDATLIFGLFTGGGSTAGEKLAFLGDLGFRAKELYDSFTLKEDGKGNITADVLTLRAEDGQTVKDQAEELLEVDTGFDQKPGDMTADEVLENFAKDRPCDDEILSQLIDEMDLDVDLEEVTETFEREVKQELDEDFYYEEGDSFDHFQQVYDNDGNLIREYYYGGDSQMEWAKYYDGPTGQLTMEQFFFDGPEENQRLVSVYTYYPAEELQIVPEGGPQLKTFDVYEYPNVRDNYYGDLGNGQFGEAYLFNEDGTLNRYETAGYAESYEGNNELCGVTLSNGDGTTTIYSYYTSASKAEPQGLGYRIHDEASLAYVRPAGHLREVKVIQPNPSSVLGPHTIYDFGYSVASWGAEGGTAYGYIYYETGVNSSGETHKQTVAFVPGES